MHLTAGSMQGVPVRHRRSANSYAAPAPCRRRYFASVWNYLDLSSYTLMAVVFVLHITRANNQLFRILVALQALLLCIRSLYFLLAVEHLGALVRMVMQVGASTQ